jgi:hypothetical protein
MLETIAWCVILMWLGGAVVVAVGYAILQATKEDV